MAEPTETVVTHVGREASERDREAWARMTRFGQARTAQEMVINTSKKTALTITSVSIAGANAADFSVDAPS